MIKNNFKALLLTFILSNAYIVNSYAANEAPTQPVTSATKDSANFISDYPTYAAIAAGNADIAALYAAIALLKYNKVKEFSDKYPNNTNIANSLKSAKISSDAAKAAADAARITAEKAAEKASDSAASYASFLAEAAKEAAKNANVV